MKLVILVIFLFNNVCLGLFPVVSNWDCNGIICQNKTVNNQKIKKDKAKKSSKSKSCSIKKCGIA